MLLFGFAVLNLFWPKRTISELENRRLAQMPAFSWQGLLDGSWTADFGEYLQDQVAFRDLWIDLQSGVNTLALQKVEQGTFCWEATTGCSPSSSARPTPPS